MRVYQSECLSINKLGYPGGDAYLVMTPESSLLYDSGFAFSAGALIEELEVLLGERELDYLFLTHSHYDHASGSVWIKERWPQVIILGSAHAARVFERPGARESMKELDCKAAKEAYARGGIAATQKDSVDYSLLDALSIEVVVDEGSTIDLGSVTLEVIAAPGHTRCSLMLWCSEEELLLGSESLGVQINETLAMPVCLTGYHDSLATLAKAQALHPKHILVNHREVVSGNAATRSLENAELGAKKTAQMIWAYHDEGKSKAEIAAALKDQFYGAELRAFQPEAAFDLNSGYIIDCILASREEDDGR